MGSIIQNNKGFKIVKLSRSEFMELGGMSICDGCNKPMETGYYIGVLNYAYCETDYNDWLLRATRYEEDIPFEEKKYNQIIDFFNVR
tara:strand:- start:15172 stop:15432 length:261 start_codon:yes stop_codon:yes gene_type:complete